jgi:hypothetical protein
VPANANNLRFFVDESALGLGKALERARDDVVYAGHKLIPEVPLGTLDVDWIPAVAVRGLVVLSRDKRIRTKPAELATYREHGLRAFWLASKRDLSTWEYLTRFVIHWNDIESLIAQRGAGPWFMALNERGITEIRV